MWCCSKILLQFDRTRSFSQISFFSDFHFDFRVSLWWWWIYIFWLLDCCLMIFLYVVVEGRKEKVSKKRHFLKKSEDKRHKEKFGLASFLIQFVSLAKKHKSFYLLNYLARRRCFLLRSFRRFRRFLCHLGRIPPGRETVPMLLFLN